MNARDELAQTVMSIAVRPDLLDYRGDYDSGAVCLGDAQRIADKILADGYTKPRTIATTEGIKSLPVGSIIQMTDTKAPFLKTTDGWESTRIPGKPVYDYACSRSHLPATVLHEPTEATK